MTLYDEKRALHNPDHDGRPRVDAHYDADPLLTLLRLHHGAARHDIFGSVVDANRPCLNPGVPDDIGSSG